jgi:hypothetical protein
MRWCAVLLRLRRMQVKGAGHMVPGKDIGKPREALALLTRFLNLDF